MNKKNRNSVSRNIIRGIRFPENKIDVKKITDRNIKIYEFFILIFFVNKIG